ncbi:hypothetical protein HOLleu_22677 [Holothuria leucospilota]|uniref:Dynein regulatory complex protein 12 n=1 Tax=Holothuria leucospilota TaxID=206669 RepID=A0A9Q1BZL2_HOLLE|nr:hypothetical protein HOLleu_22677 [Holothuria leucospilota]
MPPKKKGKGKKGKKKGKKKNDAELTIDDKYKKTLHEIEALKDHLASRKEIARRAQAHSEEWKKKMEAAHEDLVSQKDDQKSITTDMTRQYKHMQTEMNAEVHRLAAELDKTKTKLGIMADSMVSVGIMANSMVSLGIMADSVVSLGVMTDSVVFVCVMADLMVSQAQTEKQLQETTAEKEKITKEKDDLIAELQDKIKNMEFSYESMMQEALDNMVIKLDLAQKRWQEQATNIHFEHKQKLMEFGLNPLDI